MWSALLYRGSQHSPLSQALEKSPVAPAAVSLLGHKLFAGPCYPKDPCKAMRVQACAFLCGVWIERDEAGMQTMTLALKLPILQLLQVLRSFSGWEDALCSPEHPIFLGITLFYLALWRVGFLALADTMIYKSRRSHAVDLIYYGVKYIIMKNSCSYSSSLQGIPAPLWMTAHTASCTGTNGGEMAPSWRTECLCSGARLIHGSCWRHITEGTEK